MNDCPPIIEAPDDGEIIDRTDDGAIECVNDGDGMTVHVDTTTEFGEKLDWIAGHHGESPEEYLRQAIEEYADGRRP